MCDFTSLFFGSVGGPLLEVGSFIFVKGFLVCFVVLCGLVGPSSKGVGAGVFFGILCESLANGYAEWWCGAVFVWVEATGGFDGSDDFLAVVDGIGGGGVGSVDVGSQLP